MRLLAAVIAASFALTAARAEDPPKKADTAEGVKLSAKEQYDSLTKEFRAAMAEFQKKHQAAKTYEEQQKLFAQHPGQKFAGRFLALAKDDPATPVGFDCLMVTVQLGGPKGDGDEALRLLVKHHAENDKLANMMPILSRMGPGGETALASLREKGGKKVKLAATMALASAMKEASEGPGGDAKAKEAEQLFEEVAASDDAKLAKQAKAELFELRNLAVGKPMPELQSKDLDDKAVKLSDYKGKVVVLDVWATWCPPCRDMIPHERELVERLKDKPFTLISVSCDDKKETLKKFLEKEEMPWVHWFDGRNGPVNQALNIRFFPTIYVLDAKGVIRYKGVRGKVMDKAVETLLKEMEKS